MLKAVRPPVSLAMHRLSAESSQARDWLEIRTMVFWTLRLCVDVFPGPSGLIHILTQWNIFWNICTHSSRCCVSAVTLSCFVNSLCLPAIGTALLCSRVLESLPWLFVNGFSGPSAWLFHFLHGHLFHQPNPMISMPTSPSESLLLFTPWNELNFDVTGFNNTQASRDNRSCHFHAQLERRFQRHVLPPRK